jgi:hypothetical protein
MKVNGCDYTHLYMLGEMVNHAQSNGISKNDIKPSDFMDIFESRSVSTDITDRELLEQLEGEQI